MGNTKTIITLTCQKSPLASSQAHFVWNGKQFDKVRFGNRNTYAFFSIWNGKNGPELTATSNGLTDAQFEVFRQTRRAIELALRDGRDVEIAADLEEAGLPASII